MRGNLSTGNSRYGGANRGVASVTGIAVGDQRSRSKPLPSRISPDTTSLLCCTHYCDAGALLPSSIPRLRTSSSRQERGTAGAGTGRAGPRVLGSVTPSSVGRVGPAHIQDWSQPWASSPGDVSGCPGAGCDFLAAAQPMRAQGHCKRPSRS